MAWGEASASQAFFLLCFSLRSSLAPALPDNGQRPSFHGFYCSPSGSACGIPGTQQYRTQSPRYRALTSPGLFSPAVCLGATWASDKRRQPREACRVRAQRICRSWLVCLPCSQWKGTQSILEFFPLTEGVLVKKSLGVLCPGSDCSFPAPPTPTIRIAPNNAICVLLSHNRHVFCSILNPSVSSHTCS